MRKIYQCYPRQSKAFLIVLSFVIVLAHLHPAHAQTAAEQIVETHRNISKDVDESVEAALTNLVSTAVFSEAANIGALISICGFAPVLIRAAKVYKIDDAVDTDSLIKSFFSLILILLLLGAPSARGRLLADVIVGINDVTNYLSSRLIIKAAGEDGLSVVREEIAKGNAESVRDLGIENCSKIANAEDRQACLDKVPEDVEEAVEPYKDKAWAQAVIDNAVRNALRVNISAGDAVYASGKFVASVASKLASPAYELTIKTLSYLLGQAFVVGVEHVKLLMVMVAPIFLSLHLVPLFQGWFSTWLKNFLMLELALLFFNIMISLVALTLLNVEDVSSALFPFIVAAMSIIFTLLLIGGGGISLYSQATSTAVGVAGAVRRAIK